MLGKNAKAVSRGRRKQKEEDDKESAAKKAVVDAKYKKWNKG